MNLIDTGFNDYYTIHHLALNYKKGDMDSGLDLVNRFAMFLKGYSDLFSTGYADINNHSLKYFVRFFNPTTNIAHTLYSVRNNNLDISKTKNVISFQTLTKTMTIQDFNQELILALLDMAKKYKDTKPSFHTYVSKIYHYILLARLKKELKNICINSNVSLYDENIVDEEFDMMFEMNIEDLSAESELQYKKLKTKYESKFSDKHFNENWLLGNFKDSIFSELTVFERQLIKLSYINGMSDKEIAEKYGLCRNTINRRKQKIKAKLEKLM